ncbi:5'-nucleotidase C-terminal domain-containing protein [Sphingobacterium suaedae]|uniref:5'-nucleotidase C-terminal domain-containing protein n=1 Tax=Sphingobacterium suaedae TaxID=1686402 RepID=A0ABW5KGV1_9SPHI
MRSLLRWVFLFAVTLSVSSCKTKLHPTVHANQFYQIDASLAADSSIIQYYTPYKEKLQQEMSRVLGYSDLHLTKSREAESLAGNFFVDALLWKAKQLEPDVQASFATKGGIRADLKAGNVTVGDIFEMMPFENVLSIVTLSGKDMLRWADYMAQTGGQPAAGIELEIQDGKVTMFRVQGREVDANATYKLVTYDYLANGGDYVTFLDKPLSRTDYPQRIRETLMEYVTDLTKQGKHIQAQLDGRVKFIK